MSSADAAGETKLEEGQVQRVFWKRKKTRADASQRAKRETY